MNNEGIFGGTGLLGSEAAKQLIERGHEVSSIALPPLPTGAVLPPEMKIEYGNYLEMSDDDIRRHFDGCEGFVFAAGVIAVSVFHIGPGWLIGCGIIFGLLCAVLVIDRVEKAESDRKDG